MERGTGRPGVDSRSVKVAGGDGGCRDLAVELWAGVSRHREIQASGLKRFYSVQMF